MSDDGFFVVVITVILFTAIELRQISELGGRDAHGACDDRRYDPRISPEILEPPFTRGAASGNQGSTETIAASTCNFSSWQYASIAY